MMVLMFALPEILRITKFSFERSKQASQIASGMRNNGQKTTRWRNPVAFPTLTACLRTGLNPLLPPPPPHRVLRACFRRVATDRHSSLIQAWPLALPSLNGLGRPRRPRRPRPREGLGRRRIMLCIRASRGALRCR